MELTVKLYPGLQHAKGSRLTIHLREPAAVADLLQELGFGQHEVEVVAVNGELRQYDAPLHHGDTVVLMPFIGGG